MPSTKRAFHGSQWIESHAGTVRLMERLGGKPVVIREDCPPSAAHRAGFDLESQDVRVVVPAVQVAGCVLGRRPNAGAGIHCDRRDLDVHGLSHPRGCR